MTDFDLHTIRARFPILARTVYMNSNSMGAMPQSARDAVLRYCEAWATEGVEAWETWLPFMATLGDRLAAFFGGAPGCTALNQNVAFFQSAIASALKFSGPRNRVVMEALQFPNLAYVWERFSDVGAQLVQVPSDDGATVPTARILEAIDERTAIVVVSHGIYVSGALQDIAAICARAHEVGALVMVDVYQTIGCVPFDVNTWDADMVVGGCHKWLCGGPGTAFLWVRPQLLDTLRPKTTGWMAHAQPFAFEAAPIRYAQGPFRLLGGTPSMPAYYIANAALDEIEAVGMDTIRTRNLALTRVVVERAQAAGLRVHSPLDPNARTGVVAVDFPHAQAVSRALIAEDYKHDYRPGCGLRIGPHFYTSENEVHRFMDRTIALAQRSASSGAHKSP